MTPDSSAMQRRYLTPPRGIYSSVLTDIVVWLAATEVAALARFNFEFDLVSWPIVSALAVFSAGVQLLLGAMLLLYRSRYQPGSFDEIRAVAVSVTATSIIATLVVLVMHPAGLARSIPFLTWPLALIGMAAVRVLKRLIAQASRMPSEGAERILILGAGWVGSALAVRMIRDPKSQFRPVGFLDDDPSKRNLQVHGVRVYGRFEDLASVAERCSATRIVIAVNDADAPLIRKISDAARDGGLACMVLPSISTELRGSPLPLSALRDVDVEDVIGRRPVETDVGAIVGYLTGKRVLVTGAGGSIGSELCRQLHKYGPAKLVMLDRDESALLAGQPWIRRAQFSLRLGRVPSYEAVI